jgi:prepilin-type N-terminal cleavage/methylation domain-containing protein
MSKIWRPSCYVTRHLTSDIRHLKGFTLVEMAMVLVVIGLVILIVYPALNAVRVSTQRRLTDNNLQSLLRAVAVYAQTTGCLPCPSPASIAGPGFGRVRGDTNTSLCGSCAQPEGIAPFVSLGLPESTARDGWGRWITMRVDPALTVIFGVVPPSAPCTASDMSGGLCTQTGASQKGLCRTGLPTTHRITVQTPGGPTQQAAVLFASHGFNGHGALNAGALSGPLNGARLPFPPSAPGCAGGGHETCNADGDVTFVNAPPKLDNNNPFDDTLAFLDRNNLVSLFGNGSCQTVW